MPHTVIKLNTLEINSNSGTGFVNLTFCPEGQLEGEGVFLTSSQKPTCWVILDGLQLGRTMKTLSGNLDLRKECNSLPSQLASGVCEAFLYSSFPNLPDPLPKYR